MGFPGGSDSKENKLYYMCIYVKKVNESVLRSKAHQKKKNKGHPDCLPLPDVASFPQLCSLGDGSGDF